MKCLIYARKSTESEDRQVQSLDDQLRIMRECAERKGLVVVEEIAESRSAKVPNNRPGFNRLIELVEKGSANAVLVWHVDRLSRNPLDGGRLGQLLIDGKLELIQTPDRQYVSEDSPIFLAIESAVAAGYSQTLSKNVKRGMESKAAKGWLPGKPPLGYRNNPWTRQIEIDPVHGPWVKRAWELMLDASLSVRQIADELEAVLPSQTHGAPDHRYRKLYALYRNPFYTGRFRFQGRLRHGVHPRFVSDGEFEFVQRKLGRTKEAVRPHRHEPLFQGLIRCGECGGPATVTKARKLAKDGSALTYVYYHCTGHRGCQKRVVEERVIRTALVDLAGQVSLLPEVYEFLIKQIEELARARCNSLTEGSIQLQAAQQKLDQRLKRLHAMRLDGELSSDEYLELKTELQAECKRTEDAMTKQSSSVEVVKLGLQNLLSPGRAAMDVEREVTESNLKNLALRLRNSVFICNRKVEFRLDETLRKIASFKPLITSSQSQERNPLQPHFLDWCTPVTNLLKDSFEERLAELDAGASSVLPNETRSVQN